MQLPSGAFQDASVSRLWCRDRSGHRQMSPIPGYWRPNRCFMKTCRFQKAGAHPTLHGAEINTTSGQEFRDSEVNKNHWLLISSWACENSHPPRSYWQGINLCDFSHCQRQSYEKRRHPAIQRKKKKAQLLPVLLSVLLTLEEVTNIFDLLDCEIFVSFTLSTIPPWQPEI